MKNLIYIISFCIWLQKTLLGVVRLLGQALKPPASCCYKFIRYFMQTDLSQHLIHDIYWYHLFTILSKIHENHFNSLNVKNSKSQVILIEKPETREKGSKANCVDPDQMPHNGLNFHLSSKRHVVGPCTGMTWTVLAERYCSKTPMPVWICNINLQSYVELP